MIHRRPAPIRRLLRALVLVLAGTAALTLALGSAHPTSEAWAASDHQAMVVIDYSSHVDTYVVHFSADSITAEQALNLTGVSVVYRPYGGMGDAICKIQQVGCDAQDCLTCDANGRYWAYSHAEAGSGHFTTSPKGVSSTTVTDGDEEGFKWGTGQSPQYVPFGSSAPPPSTTTTAAAPAPSTSAGGGAAPAARATTPTTGGGGAVAAPADGGTAASGARSTGPPEQGAATDATDGGGSTFTVPPTGEAADSGQQLAAPVRVRPTSSSRGSAVPGLIGFAVVIAALAGAGLLVRRRNRAADPAS